VKLGLDYFNALEEDVLRVTRFVEFSQENLETHSVEFVRLLLAIGSEVDVACKALIATYQPKAKPQTIDQYRSHLLRQYPEIVDSVVECPRYDLKFQPWKDWENKKSPSWWRAYNNVKHSRILNFRQANLDNVLNALAGLGVIMKFFGQHLGVMPDPNFENKLLRLYLTIITRPAGWKSRFP
jgi:hypothetical protein